MSKFPTWINVARLRTLPLSVSGVLVGAALAAYYGETRPTLLILVIMTAVGFQITSNFANDYGDGIKGVDNDDRIGPKRALQSGLLTASELRKGILVSIIINLVLILLLLYYAFGNRHLFYFIFFVILGIASIWAAIKYTIGDTAYGYRGYGDVFVFAFFGLLAVMGTMFLFTKFLTWTAVLPAITIGLLSTAVLNLNNLRDYESDRKSKKNTLIVKIGTKMGIQYHALLLMAAFASLLIFCLLKYTIWYHFLPLIAFLPIFIHLRKVKAMEHAEKLDPQLKILALSTFLLAILFYFCYNNFL